MVAFDFLFDHVEHVAEPRAQLGVGGGERDAARLHRVDALSSGALLELPLLAAAVEELNVVVEAVDLEHPGAPGGEPVVVVAVENDRGVLVDAELAHQRLEFLLRGDVAPHRIDQVGVPDDVLRARNVAALEQAGLDADLDNADLGIGEIFSSPASRW